MHMIREKLPPLLVNNQKEFSSSPKLLFIETKNYHYKSILFIVLSIQDLCDIEDELETKLGVFKVHINGKKKEKKTGESGHRSRYLSHAKRALYHLS